MINPAVRSENIKKLRDLISGIKIAMLTTVDPDSGRLYSRPMSTQRQEFDGSLWFFTELKAEKVDDIQEVPDVVVTYVDEDKNLYISASGTAVIRRDLEMMEDLWHNGLKAWFPEGLDNSRLGLIKIEIEHAEYWDGPDNAVQRMVGFMRAAATRESYQPTENEELHLT